VHQNATLRRFPLVQTATAYRFYLSISVRSKWSE
jgi:hypothetical protein